jgi:hypothetical protein
VCREFATFRGDWPVMRSPRFLFDSHCDGPTGRIGAGEAIEGRRVSFCGPKLTSFIDRTYFLLRTERISYAERNSFPFAVRISFPTAFRNSFPFADRNSLPIETYFLREPKMKRKAHRSTDLLNPEFLRYDKCNSMIPRCGLLRRMTHRRIESKGWHPCGLPKCTVWATILS